ncbi:hypothetical protein FGB62_24g09 [Gracilaria domingensis]|nr:hypothetical protein FGB62_24g09 [Gracilaria domingensis]
MHNRTVLEGGPKQHNDRRLQSLAKKAQSEEQQTRSGGTAGRPGGSGASGRIPRAIPTVKHRARQGARLAERRRGGRRAGAVRAWGVLVLQGAGGHEKHDEERAAAGDEPVSRVSDREKRGAGHCRPADGLGAEQSGGQEDGLDALADEHGARGGGRGADAHPDHTAGRGPGGGDQREAAPQRGAVRDRVLRRERRGQEHVAGQDVLPAAQAAAVGDDRGVRHVPRRRGGAAAHARALPGRRRAAVRQGVRARRGGGGGRRHPARHGAAAGRGAGGHGRAHAAQRAADARAGQAGAGEPAGPAAVRGRGAGGQRRRGPAAQVQPRAGRPAAGRGRAPHRRHRAHQVRRRGRQGRRRRVHGVRHGAAHRVCGRGPDVHRPAHAQLARARRRAAALAAAKLPRARARAR